MKQKKNIFMLAVATVFFAACTEDLETGSPIVEGNEVRFGATGLTTFEDGYSSQPETRTIYGPSKYEDGKWHYPLKWVHGDEIAVYCPQASYPLTKSANYTIEWDNGTDGDIQQEGNTAYMMKVGDNGLHWGNPEDTHMFYAFYPASLIAGDNRFENGVVHGHIPNVQEMQWERDRGDWVGTPNMDYAFMRAATSVAPTEVQDDKVRLEFTPLTTAVDITLKASPEMTGTASISQLQVMAINKNGGERQAVCGDFTYDIDEGKTTVGSPDIATDYMITISCWKDGQPITLAPGQSLTFTVFLLPGDDGHGHRDLHHLKISIPGWLGDSPAGTCIKTYENVDIPVGTKSQIVLPLYSPTAGSDNWLGSLPSNIYISQLSIPGSVNAFSSFKNDETTYAGEGKSEIDQTQTLSVEEQFQRGVRAFEIATERGGNNTTDNLGDKGHLIAGEELGSTFREAMERIANLIASNNTEFAIVMPYYSPHATSNEEAWVNQLKEYLQNIGGAINGVPIAAYKNSMTIGEARGQILFLNRTASDQTTVEGWVGQPVFTTAIYGWNADKDRWTKRGYSSAWNGEGDPGIPGVPNWYYNASGNVNFYVQEWSRVCKETGTYDHALANWSTSTKWYESKTEKLNNVNTFMTATIEALKNDNTGNNVYINSLAGYYVASVGGLLGGVSAIPEATLTRPDAGKHGDIPPFARDMNNEVYQYILNMDYAKRGPLGIMLLNYAGEDNAFGMTMYGDYIVRALIDNNFRFPLSGATAQQ